MRNPKTFGRNIFSLEYFQKNKIADWNELL